MRRVYAGSCHCGSVRFEVEADIDHVRSCDCSVCRRRSALIHRVPAEALRLLRPWNDLSEYRWGSGTAVDYFCRRCGVLPFRRPSLPTIAERARGVEPFTGWAVNTRCLDDFDPSAVPVLLIHGSRLVSDD
ncbi:GFA family protein [Bordetella sp. 2513F-2]